MMLGKLVQVVDHVIDLHTQLKEELVDVESDLIIWRPKQEGAMFLPYTRRVHTQEYIDHYNAIREPGTDPYGPRHLVHIPHQEGWVMVIFERKLVDSTYNDQPPKPTREVMGPFTSRYDKGVQPHTQPRGPGEVSDFIDGLEPDRDQEEEEIIGEIERRAK